MIHGLLARFYRADGRGRRRRWQVKGATAVAMGLASGFASPIASAESAGQHLARIVSPSLRPGSDNWQLCITDPGGWNNFKSCLARATPQYRRQWAALSPGLSLAESLSYYSADQGGVTLQFGAANQYSLILLNTGFLSQPVYTHLAGDTYVLAGASRAERAFYHELGHVASQRCPGQAVTGRWRGYYQELEADLYLFYRLVRQDGDYRRLSDWLHRRNLGLLGITPDLEHWSSYTLLALMARYQPEALGQWASYGEFRQALCQQPELLLSQRQLLEIHTLVQRRLVAEQNSLKRLNYQSQLLISTTLYATLVSLMGESQTEALLEKLALALPEHFSESYRRHPISKYPLAEITRG